MEITIAKDGHSLRWQVTNRTAEPIWVSTLVPTIADGRWRFAVDAAWYAEEGGVVVARKVDTPIPEGVKTDDRVQSGAVVLGAGPSAAGAIRIGNEVEIGGPYRNTRTARVEKIALEVGWLPVHAGQKLKRWSGRESHSCISRRRMRSRGSSSIGPPPCIVRARRSPVRIRARYERAGAGRRHRAASPGRMWQQWDVRPL